MINKNASPRWQVSAALVLAVSASSWAQVPGISVDAPNSTFSVVGAMPKTITTDPDQESVAKLVVSRWRELRVLRDHEGGIYDVSLSADGLRALTGGADGIARIWNAQTGEALHILTGHKTGKGGYKDILGVALSTDGGMALTGGHDGTARVWDAQDGRELRVLKGHEAGKGGWKAILDVSLSSDGSRALTTGVDGTARVWDTDSGKLHGILVGHEHDAYGYSWVLDGALSADGGMALTGGVDGTARVWDANQSETLQAVQILQASQALNSKLFGQAKTDVNEALRVLKGHDADGDDFGDIRGVALSANGLRALTGGIDGTARIWDVETGEPLHVLRGHEAGEDGSKAILDVSLSADGNVALTGGIDGTARIWDAQTGEQVVALRGHEGGVNGVALDADGKRAITGGEDGTARVWSGPGLAPNLQLVLREKTEDYMRREMAQFIGPTIPEPELPPVKEYEKDPFENMAMFRERMTLARTERERQIQGIQAEYRTAVEARNARVVDFEQNHLPRARLAAHARAVAEVFGHPMLEALRDENGNPKYETEVEPPRMHVGLRHEHQEELEDWVFEVPLGNPAREFFAALETGSVATEAEYRLKDDVLSLATVYARHGDRRYRGVPVGDSGYSAPNPAVSVLGRDDDLLALGQQNPNLKDVAFEEYETQQRREFEDDIPRLYRRAQAAELDSSKWLFVIGVERYDETDNIKHSRRSAEWFARVVAKIYGVTPGRQIVLLDDGATGLAIKNRLSRMIEGLREGDQVYFYYSGHGIPVPQQDNAAYILPQDGIPDFVHEDAAYQVENIYQKFMQSKAAQVIAFMDSCFTGQTDGVSVFKGEKAGTRLAPKGFAPPRDGNLAVLTAGNETQYSGAYSEKGHRMFSYFVIKELLKSHETIGDLGKKVAADVTSTTMDLGGAGKQQDPVLQGNITLEL